MRRASPTRFLHLVAMLAIAVASSMATAADLDGDSVEDSSDNCETVANDQSDVDLDGWGDACDFDIGTDGAMGGEEFGGLVAKFGCSHTDPCWDLLAAQVDFNGNGSVGGDDFGVLVAQFGSSNPPSGLSCVGTTPCTIAPPRFDETAGSTEVNALPIVQVLDSNYDSTFDQLDVDAAMTACGTSCNLLFLAATYDGIAMIVDGMSGGDLRVYGYGDDDAEDETVLRSPLFEAESLPWAPTLALRGGIPAAGVIVQGITFDGRKQEQQPPALCCGAGSPVKEAIGIDTNHDSALRSNVVVRRNELRNYVWMGIRMARVKDSLVEDNTLHSFGCNQLDDFEPCGEDLSGSNPWDALPDNATNPPGTKRTGHGMWATLGSQDVTIRGNEVRRATKIGIEVFGPACLSPGDGATRGIVIDGNLVEDSVFGITLNGGCEHVISNNQVVGMTYPGTTIGAWGMGISNVKGAGTTISGNTVSGGRGQAYQVTCGQTASAPNSCDDQLFLDNISINNGTDGGLVSDLFVKGAVGFPANGLTIENFDARSGGNALHAIEIRRWNDVTISNVAPPVPLPTIQAGSLYAIDLSESDDVLVDDVVIEKVTGSGDTAVIFTELQDAPNGIPMKRTAVTSNATLTGFGTGAVFSGAFADDCVAYCPDTATFGTHWLCTGGPTPLECQ